MAKRRTYEFADDDFLARLERLHLAAKRLAARGHPGPRRSRRLGDGLEFADHRGYFPGDDVRFIDWPYYARMERLLLRLFHEHSEADVLLLLDASASMSPAGDRAKFDYARRAAAALAYVAMGSLERVIVQPFADGLREPMRSGRDRAQAPAALKFLDGLVPAGRTALGECVNLLCRQRRGGGTCIIVSDLMDVGDELSEALARLADVRWETTVIHVYAPADAEPALAGPVLLQHAETGERMSVHATEELREGYRRRFEAFLRGCERACVSRGAAYAAAPTDVPFEQLVLTTLRRAGVIAG